MSVNQLLHQIVFLNIRSCQAMSDKKARPFDFLVGGNDNQVNKRIKEDVVSDTSSESADDDKLRRMASAFRTIIEVQ